MNATLRTRQLAQIAAAGMAALVLGIILGVAALSPAGATIHRHGKPGWVHVERIRHHHHGFPCVVVWGGNGDTSALVCRDGYASTS